MKRLKKAGWAAVILAAVGLLAYSIWDFWWENLAGIERLELDLSGGTVVSELDTHGGFQGDGDTFVVMTFPQTDRPALEREMTGPYWHPLPLTDNLARVTYNLALGEDGEPFFPEMDQGCYYFRDRHSESQDPTDESGLFNRGSWNFTLAIYDSQTGTLYYYELDT